MLAAAEARDWGKADERFQALLRRADRTEAWLLQATPTDLLAKSEALPLTPAARRQARERAGLPSGFRQMLSVQLLASCEGLPLDEKELDLILYLVGAHHGRGRPFAPVVTDANPPDVALTAELLGRPCALSLTGAERRKSPPHSLDSGVGARFWRMQRRYGWWGAAYWKPRCAWPTTRPAPTKSAGPL
ncbi:MAG: hypothetical protein CFK52_08630 [Chloracidobacterium sp. CP2_5A]|nr:MAG: hypothetical protein CFK52_08630 [Chloracidobacterium sp. CP2_5A]